MIETFMLLHDKYYGEYSQLVKLHASYLQRGDNGAPFFSARRVQSDNPSQEGLPKYGMRYQIQS